jgi:hypothetical protein
MAVAAPARRSATPAAPLKPPAPAKRAAAPASPVKQAPARKRPLRPTRGRPKAAAGTAAPARKAPARKPATRKPATRKAPAKAASRKAAPRGSSATARSSRAIATRGARAATARRAQAVAPRAARATAQRAVAGGQLIPLAVGRTAVAVSQLPDSGLVVRLTRGRAWIGLLGVLLVGIVALNVVTLSFAASSGKIDEQITTLEEENSILRGRDAQRFGIGAVRNAAAPLGLSMPSSEEIHFIDAGHGDAATAAARLAAAGG